MRKNLGGWPYRPKTIFDAAARRTATRAGDKLDHAKEHLRATVDGDLWDAVAGVGDWATTMAMDILDDAQRRVNATENAAHEAAKARS